MTFILQFTSDLVCVCGGGGGVFFFSFFFSLHDTSIPDF
jgi:hypothetical protein